MHHAYSPFCTGLGQQTRRLHISPLGCLGLALTTVDVGERRSVDQDVGRFRTEPVEKLFDGTWVRNIKLG